MTTKWLRPRSIPHSRRVSGHGSRVTSTTNDAKNLPAASRITVTEVGTAGRSRDHTTITSPIFGSLSLPLSSTLKRAFEVNRIDCRESFLDRNLGGPTLGPFRLRARELKKFR
jgi:hypothetical protein